MGRRRKGEPPKYRRHSTGQGFAVDGGVYHYFGKHGTAESRRRYREFLRRWEDAHAGRGYRPAAGCTVLELVAGFMAEARRKYRRADGTATSQVALADVYLRPLVDGYGGRDAGGFEAADLEALRDAWVAGGLARSTINVNVGRVRRVFRWGLRKKLVPAAVLADLESVPDLAPNEGGRETEPVGTVDARLVADTLPYLSATVRAMVELQELLGCRPGELCAMTAGEVSREGVARVGSRTVQAPAGLWTFQPRQHKGRRRGKEQIYLVGPKAQAVLGPRLEGLAPGDYVFVPTRPRGRLPCYSTASYAGCIRSACEAAGVDTWGPNRLRHNAVTRYDAAEGIQRASEVVGHDRLDTTAIYAERRLREAGEAVRRHG